MKKPLIVSLFALLILAGLLLIRDAQAGQSDRHDARQPSAQHRAPPRHNRPIGYRVKALPAGHLRLSIGGTRFFYHGGIFYRENDSVYVVVAAPLGARVGTLPGGSVSLLIGGRRYHYVNATYFIFEPKTQEYVVVAEPEGAADSQTAAEPMEQLFVYPRDGQSEETMRRDRYECYVWASEQSGFDPVLTEQPANQRDDYDRASSACLEGRGYTVR